MFLKPKVAGQIVRHPDTKRLLKQEGEEVKKSTYWLRRLNEGSVIEVKKAEVKTKITEAKPKKDGGNK